MTTSIAGSWIERDRVRDRRLFPVIEKLEAGVRLGFQDGLALFGTSDLLTLGALANRLRETKNGDKVFFNRNRHINPTNICTSGCTFCAFARKPGQKGGYTLTPEEVAARAVPGEGEEWDEIHMVGGLNPDLSFGDCLEMLRAVKKVRPGIHLKAFTLVEVDHFARREGRSPEEVLAALREAGMDSLPGGGAEILGEDLRRRICPGKITGDRWLDLARRAHRMGIRSNCTMLYGHVETIADRVDHILRLREVQDETGGFMAFIPLRFQRENTPYEHLPGSTGHEDLKTIASSRLLFDNVDHIKVYWVMMGLKVAQTALWFGADDLDGTVGEEKIGHEAGARTPTGLSLEEILRLVRKAGRTPVERDTLYGEKKHWN